MIPSRILGPLALLLCFLSFSLFGCEDSTQTSKPSAPISGPELAQNLRKAMSEGGRVKRMNAVTEQLQRLNADNVDEVIELFTRERSMLIGWESESLIDAWGSFDPEAAYEYVLSLPVTASREPLLGFAIQVWARQSPLEARDRIKADLERGRELQTGPQTLYENLVIGWVHSGQPGVVEYVAETPDFIRGINSRAIVGAQNRALGTAGLLDWTDSVLLAPNGALDDAYRKMLLQRVVAISSMRDPEAVSEWIHKHLAQPYGAPKDSTSLMNHWVKADPDAAMTWALEYIPDPDREPLLNGVLKRWLRARNAGADEWVSALSENSPVFDQALYVRALHRVDTDSGSVGLDAVRDAERIKSLPRRNAALKELLATWYANSPLTAESWLQASSLSDAQRESIRVQGSERSTSRK
ncbi:MAG: hypothetical protein CL917_17755 [Deltaproteobacteria bacterium]|nr:hypothetical protein [Deltaproteobacteria bacterium]